MPYNDRAATIRTLEKRRDWGNYACSPVGRPTGDTVIARLAVKCHKEKGEKSGHVGRGFQVLSQDLRAGDPVYAQFTSVQRMDFTPYITMTLSCARWCCLTLKNTSACFQRWLCHPVDGVLLIIFLVNYVQQCIS